jgi:hypothetical protein
MTLRVHKVDYIKPNNSRLRLSGSDVDGMGEYLEVPVGWQIAAGDEEDRWVCRSHDWGCEFLVFANGDLCGTEQHVLKQRGNFFHERRGASLKNGLIFDGDKVAGSGGDVLLTKSN